MDMILNNSIYSFLQLENPTDEQIIEGATLLLKCNPRRERGLYNSALRRPKSMLSHIRHDLKKYYDIRQRGFTTPEVEKFEKETVAAVEETLSQIPSTVERDSDEVPLIPVLGIRGQRADHDTLPEEIQAIWERNAERWKKMRQLHAQLALMIAKPDYAPCDGNELCYTLRQVDADLRNDYEIYDSYAVKEEEKKPEADRVEVFLEKCRMTYTDYVKTVQNARTAISRGLARKTPHTDKSLKTLQDAVNTLYALYQEVKEETAGKLKALGISIPGNA